MLNLLLGTDRIVLSRMVMDQIHSAAEQGLEGQILIVPEQFSHEAERRLCQVGGDTISRYAEVLSFSRLSDRVASVCGGAARAYLDRGGQLLTMALAAEQISSRIKLYAAVLRKPEFLCDVVKMIEEFRSYCLEPGALLEASRHMEGQFAQKLEELGLLYEAYLAVCANSKADPSDKLYQLRDRLENSDWAADKRFYVDGFSDFTGSELQVLETLMQQSKAVSVFLSDGGHQSPAEELVQQTARELKRLAQQLEVPCVLQRVDQLADRNETVQKLLNELFVSAEPIPEVSDKISLRQYDSVEEECRGAADRVKQLMQQGARCRDISVACTDLNTYEAPLRSAFRMAQIPVYYAGETDLLGKPVIGAVLHALEAASGAMEYEDMALYLKSGLPQVDQQRCDRLDNYAYRWNLRGSKWEQCWDLHPRGFGETWTEADHAELAELNESRSLALDSLIGLRKRLFSAKNTGEMVLAFHTFLETVRLRERLEEQAAAFHASGNGQLAQELQQLYEILLQSLEQTWLILGKTVRSPEDFAKLYRLLLTQYRVATIPAGLDQVHVSDLPDLRHRQVCHLLVLGASDGQFPSYRVSEGLLTEEERRNLARQGVSIAPGRADQMEQEMGRIASALAAGSETLWLSCSGQTPAWLFRRAAALFPQSLCSEDKELFLDMETLAAWRLRHEDRSDLHLPGLEEVENALRSLRAYEFEKVAPKTVQGLYGRQMYLSASRIDKYAACRFAFFLAYGLKAQPRRKAKLDPSVFGTFVHAVLEQVVRRVMELGGFRELEEAQLLSIATEEIDRYASLHFPEQAQRAAYLFRRSQSEILDIVMDLGEELKHSLFQPAACELEFSNAGQLPPIEIRGEDASCRISGFVDRVDLYEEGGKTYVRVVDYKTGKKDFDYTDILNGAGLQMLIYLFALRQYGGELFRKTSLEPAGVLYLPARKEFTLTSPMPDDETVAVKHMEERRRKGLILDDAALLAAMEADPQNPRYMPYSVGRQGLKGDLADQRQMILLERHVIRTLAAMTDSIASGEVGPNPVSRGQFGSCTFCDYREVCHQDLCTHETRTLAATPAAKFWEKLEQEEENHG